ncbi:unnamed protein product [Prorocentrum cordatum]|uniref:Uncharacterized protein n=1 Tax=Prorocentrum cordatum TaxID=2364126 RepID=A0ABN9XHS1_9DINO|nr:unnamed protein product [Polarella glacialis]
MDSAKKKPGLRVGKVRALGPGKRDDLRERPLLEALSVGDTVLWQDYTDKPLDSDADNNLFLVGIRSIKAKVKR